MSTARDAVEDVGVSAREAEVLTALGDRLTNAEIAAQLFISIRTVESHVSSLLRKFQVSDRRALADIAGSPTIPRQRTASSRWPSPLTSFVGRIAERTALTDALATHRLVTAIGPGGVGKTRLALSVLDDVHERFPDGTWYVDLVPVPDGSMIAPAIASTIGLGEQQGRSAEETVLDWVGDRHLLLVLDNCEHVIDGVVVLLERLLGRSPGLTVLATSRARLLAPFEWAFPVPGLSVDADHGGGDAVELFLRRAGAAAQTLGEVDRGRVAEVCRSLDGMALAIELAAARFPSLGLDGLEAGLADRMQVLTGAPRIDDRHRSLRSTLDWSYALLDPAEQATLRRCAVFASTFNASAVVDVFGQWPPVPDVAVPTILAALADKSLLVTLTDANGTCYRAAETVRQYGDGRRREEDEVEEAAVRHLDWCLDVAVALEPPVAGATGGRWRASFDRVADELRAALRWANDKPEHHATAHLLAMRFAELLFARGLPGEAQRRYEQAARLTGDDRAAVESLRLAAGAASSRHFGHEALALFRAAAGLALRTGDPVTAARELARSAELVSRTPGLRPTQPTVAEGDALLAAAWTLVGSDTIAEARAMIAEAFRDPSREPLTAELTDRAIALARRAGDPLIESAALDQQMSVELARGDISGALATVLYRVRMLDRQPVTSASGFEIFDGLCMASECSAAAGNLPAARGFAERVRDLSFYREEPHLGNARLIVAATLAGDFDEAIALGDRFLEGWERAGRPRAGNLSRAPYAVATAYGLRGDDKSRAAWIEVVHALSTPGRALSDIHHGQFFDAWVWLHRGQPDRAADELHAPPEELTEWFSGMWRPWYAALWAEAGVLAGIGDVDGRLERARWHTRDNAIARAIVDRADALRPDDGDRDGLLRAAAIFEANGCRYQQARTLVLAGGADRVRGEAAMADMGTAPMVWPPG